MIISYVVQLFRSSIVRNLRPIIVGKVAKRLRQARQIVDRERGYAK